MRARRPGRPGRSRATARRVSRSSPAIEEHRDPGARVHERMHGHAALHQAALLRQQGVLHRAIRAARPALRHLPVRRRAMRRTGPAWSARPAARDPPVPRAAPGSAGAAATPAPAAARRIRSTHSPSTRSAPARAMKRSSVPRPIVVNWSAGALERGQRHRRVRDRLVGPVPERAERPHVVEDVVAHLPVVHEEVARLPDGGQPAAAAEWPERGGGDAAEQPQPEHPTDPTRIRQRAEPDGRRRARRPPAVVSRR